VKCLQAGCREEHPHSSLPLIDEMRKRYGKRDGAMHFRWLSRLERLSLRSQNALVLCTTVRTLRRTPRRRDSCSEDLRFLRAR
jgi:hypothetical protein